MSARAQTNRSMTYNELVQLFFDRSNAAQWYWTLYVVIVGGLLAFSAQRQQRDFATTLLMTVLFAIFAYKNLDALEDTTRQRHVLLDAIKRTTPVVAPGATDVKATLEPSLTPATVESVRTTHLTSDVLTILALWAMERRRRKAV
ncbi:hypothetical protein AYO41_03135 [Verrucomicrobia bacterium SCGC AG-212-E04]|nr:hypothetical protein AYO41_03135 [Verrucomicrobia bacterium SCGC AG-212-E04]